MEKPIIHAETGGQPAEMSLDETGQLPTQLENKAMIIDKELNRHGMGRYQWLIWAICGTGYLLDVMWAQAFGLAIPNLQRELGFSDKQYGNLGSSFSAGITAGAFVWGILVDVIGRRSAFLGTTLIAGIFGICIGAPSTYDSILVLVAFTGFGVGGNIPIDTTITVEYLPEDRFYLLAALSLFQPLGVSLCTIIGFGFIPNYSCATNLEACHLVPAGMPCCTKESNMGWRYLFFTLGAITLAIFILRFFIFPFHESPKFLLSKGNDQAAVDVVRKIAEFNRQPCHLTLESLYSLANESPMGDMPEKPWRQRLFGELNRLKLLFASWRMARITILVWVTWMFDYWGFGIAGTYLPTILQRKNGAIHVTLKQTYIDYLIVVLPAILAIALAIVMIRLPVIGRKWTLVFSSMFMGISLFLYSIVNTQASRVGFNLMEYFFQSLFNAVLFGWTPEAFPAAVRGTASGLASFWGNILGITGPLIAAQLFARSNGSNAVLYLAGSGLFICTICLICLPAKNMVASRY